MPKRPSTPKRSESAPSAAWRASLPSQAARAWFVLMQVATLAITWPLWQVRVAPREAPLLPALPLPQFGVGELVLVSLAFVLVMPRLGVAVHGVVLALAMLLDQTRMQPECISLWLLMLGTLPERGPKLLARMHLASLWFFSGLHKLLSPAYFSDMAEPMWSQLMHERWPWGAALFGWSVIVVEVVLGVAVLVPRSRKLATWVAVLLHVGILTSLASIRWNHAVWPWNLSLPVAALLLVRPWKEALPAALRTVGPWVRVAAVGLLVSPLGYYAGVVDAYLAHCLYSANIPEGRIMPAGRRIVTETFAPMNVPVPPSHRNYRAYYRAVATPGTWLLIDDWRPCARWGGYDHVRVDYENR